MFLFFSKALNFTPYMENLTVQLINDGNKSSCWLMDEAVSNGQTSLVMMSSLRVPFKQAKVTVRGHLVLEEETNHQVQHCEQMSTLVLANSVEKDDDCYPICVPHLTTCKLENVKEAFDIPTYTDDSIEICTAMMNDYIFKCICNADDCNTVILYLGVDSVGHNVTVCNIDIS